MKEYFIDEKVKILTGQDARKALEAKSDREFISQNKGIITVPVTRWMEAQRAERVHWMIRGIGSLQDRNNFHAASFGHYKVLHNIQFKNAIELGCGPFTNLRIIGTKCRITQCTLLDPLIEEYLSHPFCSYDDKYLYLESGTVLGRLLRRIFPKINKMLRATLHQSIPVNKILATPIELMPPNERYDVVILINVLEHCYDVPLVLEKILDIMAEGATIIFHDKYYQHEEVVRMARTGYDAAHPLKADKSLIEEFLNNNFEMRYKNVQKHIEPVKVLEDTATWEEVYYIGTKKHK